MTEETKMILDRLEKLDRKISSIQLTLENETNHWEMNSHNESRSMDGRNC